MHTSRSPQRILLTHVIRREHKKEYGVASFYTLHAEDQLPLCGYKDITPVKFPRRNVNIVGSCNGILLLYENGVISLWNPSIMRQLTLPYCPLRRCSGEMAIGLGFDPMTDDHKVVSIPAYGNGNGESSFVYTIKTGAWHTIASRMPLYDDVKSTTSYLNGVLHWVVGHSLPNSEKRQLCYNIMTFDLSSHVFGMIALPKPSWPIHQVTTIQGSVAVISMEKLFDDSWIWVRRDADASWSVIFKSKTNQIQAGVKTVLGLTNNGDLLLETYFQGLQVYNPKKRSRSSLVNFNDDSFLFDMDTFVESLQLLHMGTACKVNHLFLQETKRK
ncbi:unnamed protein product [Lactuca saligna]|uniref:F-box associated beta-propeller type 3 domain-containing protein n=1 Tax=Lactuca saligna TaxID=75948 RepID=A0AA35YKM8_LACSI|nr:unnamed protein product [Lactuca saligna]